MTTPARYAPVLELPRAIPANWGSHLARGIALGDKLFDMVAVLAAIYAADALHAALRPETAGWQTPSARLIYAMAFGVLFVFLLERHGGYRPCLSLLAIRETERVLRVTLQSFALALVVVYLAEEPVSRWTIGLAALLVPVFLVLEKWQLHNLLIRLRSKGYGKRRALILGTGSTARRLYTALIRSPKLGIEPVAFVEEGATTETTEIFECAYRRKHSARVLMGPVSSEMSRRLDVSVLIIAEPGMDREAMQRTLSEASQIGVDAYFTTQDFADAGFLADYAEVDGIMLAHPSRGGSRALNETGKRLLDVAVAVFAMLLFAPAAAVIAVLIRKTSPGPVFFRQQRVGKGGRRFAMYKFRTMFEDAPQYGYSPGQVDDPRVTPVGRFLRRTSLDEFPQLINVLLGQMSLVGPRPEMPFIVEEYTPLQRQRLAVKPGMTGLWQISADRAFLIHENVEYDLYYLKNNPAFVWGIALQFAGIRKFELNTCSAGPEVHTV